MDAAPLTLTEYLKDRAPKGFKPAPHFSVDGGFASLFFEDVRCHAENRGPDVVLYRADTDNRVVGVKVFLMPATVEAARKASEQP